MRDSKTDDYCKAQLQAVAVLRRLQHYIEAATTHRCTCLGKEALEVEARVEASLRLAVLNREVDGLKIDVLIVRSKRIRFTRIEFV